MRAGYPGWSREADARCVEGMGCPFITGAPSVGAIAHQAHSALMQLTRSNCIFHVDGFMHMLTPCELSLQRLAARAPGLAPVCEILREAKPTGVQVPGAALEAAARWQSFTLLLTTDDVPSEEFLHIHLLDPDLQCIDSATLGAMYSTGSFSLLPSSEPDTLRFRFIGDTDWSVQVLPQPGFRVPLWSEPTGVSRPVGFSRHFVVRGNPQRTPR